MRPGRTQVESDPAVFLRYLTGELPAATRGCGSPLGIARIVVDHWARLFGGAARH
jgi:hypothetical protein